MQNSSRVQYYFTARKRSLRRLCFYTCLSFCPQGGLPHCMLGYHTPWQGDPLARRAPWHGHLLAGQTLPGKETPLARQTPPARKTPWQGDPPGRADPLTPRQGRHPPGKAAPLARRPSLAMRPPSPRSACWEIRSTSGRYASYWNAILLNKLFTCGLFLQFLNLIPHSISQQ